MLPGIVAHADWSTDPGKRWMVKARRLGDVYRIEPPEPVRAPETLVRSCVGEAGSDAAVIGFDFPIGIPAAYAQRTGIKDFRKALMEFGHGRWSGFYDPATTPEEISPVRPFYPARPGGTKQQHLVDGLGVESMAVLLRACDRGTGKRNNACPLFWTLGGNQVGRAAIAGWRHAIVPALTRLGVDVALWPFDGAFGDLLASRACVLAETYPADACVQLGLPAPGRGWSKRRQDHRREMGRRLLEWSADKPIDLAAIRPAVEDGFGYTAVGEDRFDAWVGALGMLAVVLGLQGAGAPRDVGVQRVEGWILGQKA